MEKYELVAEVRQTSTKSSRSEIRKNGKVTGVFYSSHDEPISIAVLENAIKPLVFTAETHLVDLKLDNNKSFDCIVKDVQFDPVTDKIVHFDLFGLTKGEKLHIEVPVALKGSAVGVKDGGVLQQLLHKLNIECLPKDIPQHIDLDISGLKIGQSISVADLSFEGLTILNPEDAVVVTVTAQRAEKTAEETAGEVSAEPEVISKGKVDKED